VKEKIFDYFHTLVQSISVDKSCKEQKCNMSVDSCWPIRPHAVIVYFESRRVFKSNPTCSQLCPQLQEGSHAEHSCGDHWLKANKCFDPSADPTKTCSDVCKMSALFAGWAVVVYLKRDKGGLTWGLMTWHKGPLWTCDSCGQEVWDENQHLYLCWVHPGS